VIARNAKIEVTTSHVDIHSHLCQPDAGLSGHVVCAVAEELVANEGKVMWQ